MEGENLTSLDYVEVLGINISMLGEIEVLLRDEYALCGDRVSAYPYVQLKLRNRETCAIAMARKNAILTSEEVPKK